VLPPSGSEQTTHRADHLPMRRGLQPRPILTSRVQSGGEEGGLGRIPTVPFTDGQFVAGRAVDLGSDPRTEQPTVAGDMVNKSVSGDLLPKWHAGDNIHALPAFTCCAAAAAPGHPSGSRCWNIPARTELCPAIIIGDFISPLHGVFFKLFKIFFLPLL